MKKQLKLSETELLFCSLALCWSSTCIPLWPHSSLFLLFFLTYCFVFSLNYYKAIFLFTLAFGFYQLWHLLCTWLVNSFKLSEVIDSYIYYLRDKVTGVIEDKYAGESGKFISYFLFNKKNSTLYPIINDFRMLSLSHLLVVSGMHLNIVDKGISKLLKWIPYRWVRAFISLTVLGSYAWATGFAIPATRVFSEKVITTLKKQNSNPIKSWAQTVLLSFAFFPSSVYSYSFVLSYLYSLSFRVIDKLELTKLRKNLTKISFACLLSVAFFSHSTRKIFPLAGINQILLTPIVICVFIYYLLTWPFKLFVPVGTKIYGWLKSFVASLELNKSFIERGAGSYLEPLYLTFGLSLVSLFISKYYLIKRERF